MAVVDGRGHDGPSLRAPTKEIARRQLPDLVAESLREMIMSGALRPGEHLRMRPLAEQFDVSVIPVRDALRLLAAEGLVELRPHRGAVVMRISIADLEEIFLARLPLEQLAAFHALAKFDVADVRRLRRLEGQMERTSDPRRWLELNREFHLTMYRRAGYPRILRIVEGLWDLVEPYLLLFMRDREAVRSAEREHREMVAAIEGRDADTLAALITRHLMGTAILVAGILGTDAPPAWAVDRIRDLPPPT